ncbi:hypothetical protein FOL47_010547 [Perkinsus chesapeaki]|uniref:Core Histone H2A/H2B/H3 domain-containing protein n=1 Tax=Perkinsus chesapeaki TaxID=330153 RepID=A0A7J6L3P7_PERCH|nr:hypothetical protein FOL47_010547 [Perkinsus chesapeaki]
MAPKKKAIAPPPAAAATPPPASVHAPMSETQGSASPKKRGRRPGEKRRRRHTETYNTYIFRVLKQVHPNTGISKKSMMIMNSFVNDTFERIVSEAAKLCKYSTKGTLSSREIQTAIRLVLPGELAKHAVLAFDRDRIRTARGEKGATLPLTINGVEDVEKCRAEVEALRTEIQRKSEEIQAAKTSYAELHKHIEDEEREKLRPPVHGLIERYASVRRKEIAQATAGRRRTLSRHSKPIDEVTEDKLKEPRPTKGELSKSQEPEESNQKVKGAELPEASSEKACQAATQTASKKHRKKHARRRSGARSSSESDVSSYSGRRPREYQAAPLLGLYPPMVPLVIPYPYPTVGHVWSPPATATPPPVAPSSVAAPTEPPRKGVQEAPRQEPAPQVEQQSPVASNEALSRRPLENQ